MKTAHSLLTSALLAALASHGSTAPLGTAFTYQGRLNDGASPANGLYEFQFSLYDAVTNGSLVGTPVSVAPLPVSNGVFHATLDFGANAFTGGERWLEITVSLYGSDMMPVTLKPRQYITATPYALYAANAGGLMSLASAPLDFTANGQRVLRLEPTPPNDVYAEGAPNVIGGSESNVVAAGVAGATIAGGGVAHDEDGIPYPNRVTGPFGTVGGGFGNTSDWWATVAGGAINSAIGPHSTVAGGERNTGSGTFSTVGGGLKNSSTGYCASVSGGSFNFSQGEDGTVGGGRSNTNSGTGATVAGGVFNLCSSPAATVSGGTGNTSSGWGATVGGGGQNLSSGDAATIAGGSNNENTGPYATVGGGWQITNAAAYGTIGGGTGNRVQTNALYATIGGGIDNWILADAISATIAGGDGCKIGSRSSQATIAGGNDNDIGADALSAFIGAGEENSIEDQATHAFVGGGERNFIQSAARHAVISGGQRNWIGTNAITATIGGGQENHIKAGAQASTIGGGGNNSIETNAVLATIAGGSDHTIGANTRYSTIGGGSQNVIATRAFSATIAGGSENTIQSNAWYAGIGSGADNTVQSEAWFATISGGSHNTVQIGALYSTIGGGANNTIRNNADGATIPGGSDNLAGASFTFAAGRGAQALHMGSFVWADSRDDCTLASTTNDQFTARASGGVRFFSDACATTGVELAAGGNAWSVVSDRNAKEDFESLNCREVLAKVGALPVTTWNLKSQPASIRHIGPMAQDFHAAFGVGEDDRHISTSDADGVALAAIKGLNQKLEEELLRRDAENAVLKQRLAELERLVLNLAGRGTEP